MPGGRPKSDERTRFNCKSKTSANGCIEWQSVISRSGYGKFYFRGKQESAHRVSYILNVGEIPEGMCVLHKCDNRKCVNHEHLFVGTLSDNVLDMDDKCRRGSSGKVTRSMSDEIKRMLEEGKTQQSIADYFGVHQTTVSKISTGKTQIFLKG